MSREPDVATILRPPAPPAPTPLPRRAARRLRRGAQNGLRRVERRRALTALRADASPRAPALAAALESVASMRVAPDERDWVERIERVRAELNGSDDRIELEISEWTGLDADRGRILVNTIGEVARRKSQPPLWGLMLLRLVRTFRPRTCLELGTGLGISAAYQGAALALNGEGRLLTLEAADSRVALARQVLGQLGADRVEVRDGRFQEALGPALAELGTVDFAFIDGHHAEAATLDYFELILGSLPPGGMLQFDDITWSDGMRRAWATIAADPRLALAVDLGRAGICFRGGALGERRVHRVPLG